ncbi:MAG: hypothetical protein KJ798_09600 [Gammaproteobacteria bacterium]|uniref:hypothetical protein n=1 Tax=Limnobacter sp. TaxID=2003368 RepID=UPI001DB599BD|nr:hypothetical protein [Limnobacter sp.]MBU0783397.1 hypothetical protein [Gammaproteobacteria bacterium]MBU0850616.1 hypothetical protein [Gammaproteobacteria bacterium]MBU1267793.1 hypothetical protein [Gammaproteobacteria bacterium]MBU1529650.1 hypothetical protein [Gammaproteobacteria bacterium]MBU1780628.1 hypothetical protein [Gammaproteobacteria bacterium]
MSRKSPQKPTIREEPGAKQSSKKGGMHRSFSAAELSHLLMRLDKSPEMSSPISEHPNLLINRGQIVQINRATS